MTSTSTYFTVATAFLVSHLPIWGNHNCNITWRPAFRVFVAFLAKLLEVSLCFVLHYSIYRIILVNVLQSPDFSGIKSKAMNLFQKRQNTQPQFLKDNHLCPILAGHSYGFDIAPVCPPRAWMIGPLHRFVELLVAEISLASRHCFSHQPTYSSFRVGLISPKLWVLRCLQVP